MALIPFIIIFLAVLGLIFGYSYYRKEKNFEGQVIDKDIVESTSSPTSTGGTSGLSFSRSGVMHNYVIMVRTPQNKTLKWTVSEGQYEVIKIGDQVVKQKGIDQLEIIAQQTKPPTSAPPPQQPPVITG